MKRYSKIKDLRDLSVGDIVKSKVTEIAYTIVAHYGDRVTAVRIADITNADEWEVFKK